MVEQIPAWFDQTLGGLTDIGPNAGVGVDQSGALMFGAVLTCCPSSCEARHLWRGEPETAVKRFNRMTSRAFTCICTLTIRACLKIQEWPRDCEGRASCTGA